MRGKIGPVIQIAEKDAAILALVNQVAQPNSERDRNLVQLHNADVAHPSFHAGEERPMQTSLLRQLFLG